jgi:hypothetical protein
MFWGFKILQKIKNDFHCKLRNNTMIKFSQNMKVHSSEVEMNNRREHNIKI